VGSLTKKEIAYRLVETVAATREGNDGTRRINDRQASVTRRAAPNVWIDLYQRERKHLVEISKVAIACGLLEHEVRITKEQARILAGVFRAIGADPEMAFGSEQRQIFRAVATRHLRAVPQLSEGCEAFGIGDVDREA
jgi:hypothetical protein